jgi:hypothetical protein
VKAVWDRSERTQHHHPSSPLSFDQVAKSLLKPSGGKSMLENQLVILDSTSAISASRGNLKIKHFRK